MKGYVANTDTQWYRFLASEVDLDEVNFWQPSGRRSFRALAQNEPIFFRLKRPHHAIAGFAFFIRHSVLPDWMAWDIFERANGCDSLVSLRARVARYRRTGPAGAHHFDIGCLLCAMPVFLERDAWVREPADWAREIVQGKRYELSEGEGLRIWRECLERATGTALDAPRKQLVTVSARHARLGRPQVVRPRLGQAAFRVVVTEAYGRACAVTEEHSLPVVEAAHVRPFAEQGPHDVTNGIALRADIHKLFDRGYATIDADYRFVVSNQLYADWHNGRVYQEMHGRPIRLPESLEERPAVEFLEWHRDVRFAG